MQAISPVLPHAPEFEEVLLAKEQPQYKALPVAKIEYSDGVRSMISCYRLTWKERLTIMFTGKVWWQQLTFGQPLQPQRMYVKEPFYR